jgi:iron only hydrogenase large subunit-like protein
MDQYSDLCKKLEKASLDGKLQGESEKIIKGGKSEEVKFVELILHPEQEPPVVRVAKCTCPPDQEAACEISCLFDAIRHDKDGKLMISKSCTGCGRCMEACTDHALAGRKDAVPLLELLREKKTPVYAMIAPAFSGQFSAEVTSGRLRSAFKCLGFYGMIEVALFADILTLKEALEFDRYIHSDKDYMLTSCCCPLWVAMIRKSYSAMIPHVPPSVSPMVACGRSIKKIHPNAKTVFIGPCLAKKAEAREPDIADAVDYVLTFEEIAELFEIVKIDPQKIPEDHSDHSSRAGRIYARTGGVSEAVQATLDRLRPGRTIPLISQQADGVLACKSLLKEISEGNLQVNFIEGMGCRGGCVGGPKSLIDKETAREYVNRYGNEASSRTPADNPYVIDLLHRLGFDIVESLLERDNTFIRNL